MPYAIGIDLSYTSTGIAWPHTTDTFQTTPDSPHHIRAARIAGHVTAHATEADLIVIEDGVHRSHAAFITGILHGIVRDRLAHIWDRVLLVPPAVLKQYATGKGNAPKISMVVEARERLGYTGLDDNEADALWLRAIGQDILLEPLVTMPAQHRAALQKLDTTT